MAVVFSRPQALTEEKFSYCPGCSHGIIHRLVAEALDELTLGDRTVAIASVGCSVFSYNFFNTDAIQAAHGRAPAVATGVKRSQPDTIVFTYQGDGDLASIGIAEIVHAATRGENITVIFVNNAVYGMTSGQMAPTTLIGQVTTTTPRGRNPKLAGNPIRMSELLATLDGPSFIARVSVHDAKHVHQAKAAIKKAFSNQVEGKGFSLVEVLSSCPTNWRLSPVEAMGWIENNMLETYPLGTYKNVGGAE